MSEQKLFEYLELQAMGMIIAAQVSHYFIFKLDKAILNSKTGDAKEVSMGIEEIEEIVKNTIDIRWNDPEKVKYE